MLDYIELEPEEIDACYAWHGGMGSMLYAAASTGALRRGTIRPRNNAGEPMSDQEWIVSLAERLESEASLAASHAAQRASEIEAGESSDEDDDIEELWDHVMAFETLAARCTAFVAAATRPIEATGRVVIGPSKVEG